jgi:DNA-binding MarR family transcriptional regulator
MERTILDKLLLIAHLLQRDMARAFAGTPLTEARVSVLWVLQTLGPSTQQGMADALGVSARNVSALVDALESTGYVRRTPHPTDRRAVIVELTATAVELMTVMQREHAEVTATLLASVPRADRAAFERGIDAVVTRLGELVAEAEDVAQTEEAG